MIAPIDDRVRTFHKGLYTSEAFGYEDPTYLGFTLHFDFDPVSRNIETGITDNPLFAEPRNGIESAQEYLSNIGFVQKAAMIKEFKEMMRFMNKNAPYYFQGITGVAELWKIEKKGKDFEPYRSFEKKLKFECLETIDLRMTALADLYRSATFDEKYMRDIVPENLRRFTVTLRIAEIRSFHKLKSVVDSSNPNDLLEVVNKYISVVEFELGGCEFDFEDSFGDEFKMNSEAEMAKQVFSIKIGHIAQKSTYTLLDLLIDNNYAVTGSEIVDKSIIKGGKLGGLVQAGSNRGIMSDVPLGSVIPEKGAAINPNNLFSGAVSALNGTTQTLGEQVGNLGGQLVDGALSNLQSRITGAALGNIYDARNRSVLENINSFLGGGDQLATEQSLGDVYPNSPGSDTTTDTVDNLGNVY